MTERQYPTPQDYSDGRVDELSEMYDYELEAYAQACKMFARDRMDEVEQLVDALRATNDWLIRAELNGTGHQIALRKTLDLYTKEDA